MEAKNLGVWVWLPIDEHVRVDSMFGKNDVRVGSMSNLVNLVKALLGSMFDVCLFEPKNWVFEFDHQ